MDPSSPDPQNDQDTGEILPFAPIAVEELAPKFPGLKIERLIAVGGMGGVYLARQINLDRPVALKILPPASGRESNTADRFAHEARLMAQLTHPNIVAIYDFGESGGLYYFIMEYVHGATFHELIEAKKIDASNATQLMIPVCSGVSYAHKRGVLHHDLKPGNLMLSDEHKAKLLDFGLAGIFKPGHRDPTAAAWGTADYAAPERFIADAPIDHRADIYSLGVIYYQMLTGEVPRIGYTNPSKAVGVHPKFDEVVHRSIAQHPEERYSSVAAFEAELKQLIKLPKVKSKPPRHLIPAGGARKGVAVRPAASAKKKRSTVSAKSAPKRPASTVASAPNPSGAIPVAPTQKTAATAPAKKKRPPAPELDEEALAAQRKAQRQFEKRMAADKKKRELQMALILGLGGALLLGLLIFILANRA